jgi:hypothetical protein
MERSDVCIVCILRGLQMTLRWRCRRWFKLIETPVAVQLPSAQQQQVKQISG